jgi:hypothetical protein
MKMNQIMNLITELSYSQGFYGRLKRDILEMKENFPDQYDMLVENWESQNFKDSLDFILYIEC